MLLVEDDPADAARILGELRSLPDLPWRVVHRRSSLEALEWLGEHPETVCVLLAAPACGDGGTPDGLVALDDLADRPPVVVLTADEAAGGAPLRALRQGADDQLVKDAVDGPALARAIGHAIERRGFLARLAARELFVRTVLDTFDASIAVLDRAGRIVDVNAGWLRHAVDNDADPAAVGIGADYLEACDRAAALGDRAAAEVAEGIRAVLVGERDRFQHHYDASRPGEEVWRSLRVSRLPEPAGGAVVFHVPITDLKRTQAELHHLAHHDPLTGLPNRVALLDRLRQAAEGAADRPASLAVLFVDIDGFKRINDRYGHAVGDHAIVELGRLLRAVVRPGDLVARFGGDEFVVLCERLSGSADAVGLAERILAGLAERPLRLGGHRVELAVSIGIATGADGALDADRLLGDADTAMYDAKRRGRARHARYDASLRPSERGRDERAAALRGALDRGELALHYQPLVALATGRPYGVEALLRWQDVDGLRDTAELVAFAEEQGLMERLGGWVVDSALRDAGGARGLQIAINVSPSQLQGELVDQVERGIDVHRLDPRRIWVELTERAVMTDLDRAERVLADLRRLGVGVALDDFGTGSATLEQLQRLPLDSLKIDRSFVRGLDLEGDHTRMARAVVQLGRAFDLLVVAEGVEETRQLAALRQLGCEHGQGYLWGRPAPLEQTARG